MSFELTKIDPYECSIEELESEIKRLKDVKEEYYNLEQSIKIFINSVYGACASPYFVGYNINVAEAVTLQGQDLIKYANRVIDTWFTEIWHLDKELHKKLGLTYVNKINNSVVVYNDTDSIKFDSLLNIHEGGIKTIESFYNDNIKNGTLGSTIQGHESVKTYDKILNWTLENGLYYTKVKRIIRHKVTKSKWKLKTKSGKEVIVTNDHSLIVFRNNKQIEVKPKEIKKTDKILCIK
jgi:DNA polymerase elongation subunit (family B)